MPTEWERKKRAEKLAHQKKQQDASIKAKREQNELRDIQREIAYVNTWRGYRRYQHLLGRI